SFSIHASRSGCLVRTLQLELEPDWNRFDSNDSCIVLCEKLVSNPAACAGPLGRKETIPVDTPGYSHVKLWTYDEAVLSGGLGDATCSISLRTRVVCHRRFVRTKQRG